MDHDDACVFEFHVISNLIFHDSRNERHRKFLPVSPAHLHSRQAREPKDDIPAVKWEDRESVLIKIESAQDIERAREKENFLESFHSAASFSRRFSAVMMCSYDEMIWMNVCVCVVYTCARAPPRSRRYLEGGVVIAADAMNERRLCGFSPFPPWYLT